MRRRPTTWSCAFTLCESKWLAGAGTIFHCARPLAHRQGCLWESDGSPGRSVCLPQLVFRFANGRTRELENTNKLLRRLPYCNGMKTGYTDAAGKCLIASGTRPGKDVIVVVLGDSSSHVWRDASALLSWSLWRSSGCANQVCVSFIPRRTMD